jgi:hypothetical protein
MTGSCHRAAIPGGCQQADGDCRRPEAVEPAAIGEHIDQLIIWRVRYAGPLLNHTGCHYRSCIIGVMKGRTRHNDHHKRIDAHASFSAS